MNEDRLTELLNQAQSLLEKKFLQKVYPDLNLTPDHAQELCAQYLIDFIRGAPVTTPDFAFPDMKIAIYCDSYAYHKDSGSFSMDRFQSNELQSLGWIVFRFSDRQIDDFSEQAVRAITRAIALRDEQQQELDSAITERDKQQQELDSAITERDKQQQELDSAITERDEKQQELDSAITERDEQQQELKSAITERDKQQQELDSAITERDKQQQELDSAITERDEKQQELKSAITERDEQQQELKSAITERDEKQQELESASQATRNWKYATLVLGIGLALSFVLILILFKSKGSPPIPVPLPPDTVLIPAGEFQMGSNASNTENDEKPMHTVYVDSYYIDKNEVTNAKFKQFVDANPQWQKDRIPRKFHNSQYLDLWQGNSYPPDKEDHPVVFVSWYAAMAYAKWEGKRLPTEAEWEKAARGELVGLRYTWGNIVDPSKANYGGQVGDTTPVGSYPANDYGLYDMVGNVMEWCLDGYETDFYSRSPRLNPIAGGVLTDIVNNFQGVTSRRAIRSGCWYNVPLHVRVADRYGANPDHASKGRGFRCAGSATSSSK